MSNTSISRRELMGLAAGGLVLGPAAAEAELLKLSSRPENFETTLDVFTERFTPVDELYVRSHFDRPTVDPKTFRLKVGGLAAKPLELSLEELGRLPQVEVEAVLQCAGNGRALFQPRMPGVQWTRGAMGNLMWRGVRLADVLAKAKPQREAKHLILRGADRPVLPATPAFIRGIPIEKALHPDTLLATHMNGVPLTPSHGAPLRLVVPGWVADDWVKWLEELTLSSVEATGFFSEKAYRFPSPPGAPGEAMPPARMKPMTAMNVKSVVARPARGAIVKPGTLEVIGVAFGGESPVAKVEVSMNGAWVPAKLEGERTKYGWRVFRAELSLEAPGKVLIATRATDEQGAVQPQVAVWNPSGYLYNAIDPLEIEVRS